jgi:hypothetical protein
MKRSWDESNCCRALDGRLPKRIRWLGYAAGAGAVAFVGDTPGAGTSIPAAVPVDVEVAGSIAVTATASTRRRPKKEGNLDFLRNVQTVNDISINFPSTPS